MFMWYQFVCVNVNVRSLCSQYLHQDQIRRKYWSYQFISCSPSNFSISLAISVQWPEVLIQTFDRKYVSSVCRFCKKKKRLDMWSCCFYCNKPPIDRSVCAWALSGQDLRMRGKSFHYLLHLYSFSSPKYM